MSYKKRYLKLTILGLFLLFLLFLVKDINTKRYSSFAMDSSTFGGIFAQTHDKETRQSVLHVAMIATHPRYVDEMLVSVKSILLFSSTDVQFHMFYTDAYVEGIIETKKEQYLSCTVTSFRYTMHFLNASIATQYVQNKETLAQMNFFFKVNTYFMLNDLRSVAKILYVDTDFLFLSDIKYWYDVVPLFNDTQTAAMAPCGPRYLRRGKKYPYAKPLGHNAGLVIANLTRMRHTGFWWEIGRVYDAYVKVIKNDQDFLNVYFGTHPHQLYQLPCELNFHKALDPCIDKIKKRVPPFLNTLKSACGDFHLNGIQGLHASGDSLRKSHLITKDTLYGSALLHKAIKDFDLRAGNASGYWSNVYTNFMTHRTQLERERPGCEDPGQADDVLKALKQSVSQNQNKWIEYCRYNTE